MIPPVAVEGPASAEVGVADEYVAESRSSVLATDTDTKTQDKTDAALRLPLDPGSF